ncbi:arsenite methyltransferase [Cryobacterium fucosi]|uniref:Arsenite methyltransferase n=1 Tax=Cryobacterium fucosi TaxID=1259157 RepID=A0A4R9B710_9MICO|nr:arsenite methyltransferase [Cryobacterium fucosi]TFD75635.1 arsenite methyltransferase [Cryobacterium fucosi]
MSEDTDTVREAVRARYASAALAVTRRDATPAATAACCGPSDGADAAADCCGPAFVDESLVFGAALYDPESTGALPQAAVLASLGCGNPTAVADLRPGETVLDLGSGGGIDVLLSARRVGPTGFAYGVDMTDEMLDLARANAAAAHAENVEFRKGTIEDLPLPDAGIDVVISNCVINLSTDKPAVLREMFRVLVAGGRVGVSDVVAENQLSPAERAARGSHVGCIAGALSVEEYTNELGRAGFEQVSVSLTHEVAPGMHGAIVRAVKPLDAV